MFINNWWMRHGRSSFTVTPKEWYPLDNVNKIYSVHGVLVKMSYRKHMTRTTHLSKRQLIVIFFIFFVCVFFVLKRIMVVGCYWW